MNGHLQLSISLKNKTEIKQAIGLLESILVEDSIADIRNVRGTFIATNDEKIKPIVMTKDQIIDSMSEKKINPPGQERWNRHTIDHTDLKEKEKLLNTLQKFTPDWKKIDAGIKKNILKSKFRTAALKRKRDKHGHFLPGKVSSK